MNVHPTTLATCAALLLSGLDTARPAEAPRNASRPVEPGRNPSSWVEPMKQVHSRFTGDKGTFAHRTP